MTTDTLVSLWKTFTAGAFAAMIGISSIALVVGGIVIMNIMLVSVVERTPEIGLRKALGARSKDVKRQFLLESVILAAVGGAIGVLLGAIAGKIVSAISPLPSSLEPASGDCRPPAGVFRRSCLRLVAGGESRQARSDHRIEDRMKRNLGAIAEAFSQAVFSIRSNKLRAFLTILGIVIGVATVIGMVSIIQGLNRSMVGAMESMGPHLVQFQKEEPMHLHRPSREQRMRKPLLYEDAVAIRENSTAMKAVSAEAYHFRHRIEIPQ